MSRWLLVGEGPSEFRESDGDGFLQVLLTQLADDEDATLARALGVSGWEAVDLPELRFSRAAQINARYSLKRPQPKGKDGFARRALLAANALNCHVLIILIDGDRKSKFYRGQLNEGLRDASMPHAAGVAKEALEAWLIADPDLLPVPVRLSKQPEDIWGDARDPDGEHPKMVLSRALKEADVSFRDAVARWRVARATPRAPWLRDFCVAIINLLANKALCRPKAWSDGRRNGE